MEKPVWRARMSQGPDEEALAYCAGRDVAAREASDVRLIACDIWTNRAHVVMLARQRIVERAVAVKILKALSQDFMRCAPCPLPFSLTAPVSFAKS